MVGLAAQIALDGAAFAFDKLYTYAVPPEMHKSLKTGCRVTVPFGGGNTKKQGMVFCVLNAELKGLKAVISVIDKEPVLNSEMLKMCEFMHESCFCTYYDAVHAVLPAGLNYRLVNFYSANPEFTVFSLLDEREKAVYDFLNAKGEKDEAALKKQLDADGALLEQMCEKQALLKNRDTKRKIGDATEKWVRVTVSADELDCIKLTPRQKETARFVCDAGDISVKELMYYTGVTAPVIEKLIANGVLVSFTQKLYRTALKAPKSAAEREIALTDEQQAAYNGLEKEYLKNGGAVSLLYGITGSGKTQVFLKLADKVISQNRGVIVMVPEIALTPQMLEIFTSRYGDKVAVFHSAMSMGKRMDEWQRVKDGKALIAIGTRSAVFAPFSDLGLIIMDEEHEHTYKSEQSPRFHARDIARFRTAYHGGLLLLASATPSVESFTAAKSGKYSLFVLKNRYGSAVLPQVRTVDMKKEILSGNTLDISRELCDAISDTLSNKKQTIILLNRRGKNTYISCPQCGYVLSCPNCSISLTYHSANNRMMCHYCGYSAPSGGKCPNCGGEHLKFLGAGTQKVEEELNSLFPKARVLRLDADSTAARDSYAKRLDEFANGEYDILLGTQMVAKGLDFPNVTLVGVLGADSATYSDDFRGFERTFSLLTQVIGRAGRGDSAGTAVIQSLNPDSELIELAARQDYEGFYNDEIMTRKLMIYPPYCDICTVSTRSFAKSEAQNAVNEVFANIKSLLQGEYSDIKTIILGPAPAAVPRVNNKYRFRMIIKCKNGKRFREMLKKATEIKQKGDVTVTVDINPETVI